MSTSNLRSRLASKSAPAFDLLARAEDQTGSIAFDTKYTDPRSAQVYFVEYETTRRGHYKMSGRDGTYNIEQLVRIGELMLTSEYERIVAKHGKSFFAR